MRRMFGVLAALKYLSPENEQGSETITGGTSDDGIDRSKQPEDAIIEVPAEEQSKALVPAGSAANEAQIVHPKAADMKPFVPKHSEDDDIRAAAMQLSPTLYTDAEQLVNHQGTKLARIAADYAYKHKPAPLPPGSNQPPPVFDFKAARRFIRKAILDGAKVGSQTDNEVKMASVEAMLLSGCMAGWLLANNKAVIAYAPVRSRVGDMVSLEQVGRKYNVPRICAPFNQIMPYVPMKNMATGKEDITANNADYLTPLNEQYIQAQYRHWAENKLLNPNGTLKREPRTTDTRDTGDKPATNVPAQVDLTNVRAVIEKAGECLKFAADKKMTIPDDHLADILDGAAMAFENVHVGSLSTSALEAIADFGVKFQKLWDAVNDRESMEDNGLRTGTHG
jgi:hypothetical protein